MTPAEEIQVARGARGRALSRLIAQADRRAQRRFRRWCTEVEQAIGTREERMRSWSRYVEAEDLHSDLMRARHGGTQG